MKHSASYNYQHSDKTEASNFLVAQSGKNLPAVQETQVWFLGQEDPLEKEMATHCSILAWRIYGQRSLAGYSPWGHKSQTQLGDKTTTNKIYLLG